ncbi:hypothetical protein NKI31_12775 [Mesorhizobium sp. M0659]|uniref:hypothetical protein n=1 Tax=Mesorhizobium sp. M0659 TaxID=2956980 RepID=UPI003334C926
MAEEAEKPEIYVFSANAVRRSIDSLLKNKNHEHVPGYLALLRSQNTRVGTPSQLSDIVEVHDRYLKVLDAAENRPYLRPFVSRGKNIWFNDNISGSYAPSNVKADPGPIFRVVQISGSGLNTKYSLPPDHAARASEHLLKGHKLPINALAAFMYRDYGMQLDEPSIAAATNLFRAEFCLRADDADQQRTFETLFYDDAGDFSASDIELMQE